MEGTLLTASPGCPACICLWPQDFPEHLPVSGEGIVTMLADALGTRGWGSRVAIEHPFPTPVCGSLAQHTHSSTCSATAYQAPEGHALC